MKIGDTFKQGDKVWEVYRILGDLAEIVEKGDDEPHIVTVTVESLKAL